MVPLARPTRPSPPDRERLISWHDRGSMDRVTSAGIEQDDPARRNLGDLDEDLVER